MTKEQVDEALHKALKVLNCLNNDRVYETAWVKGAINACEEALEQEERTQRTMHCGTADAFIAMDDDHKRRWFVQSLRESKRRKELEDILEQPAQEPVGWMDSEGRFRLDFKTEIVRNISAVNKEIPLYTHPAPSWQGLSDDEIETIMIGKNGTYFNFARAIEQALKEKNNG
jgi:hypothetical protein